MLEVMLFRQVFDEESVESLNEALVAFAQTTETDFAEAFPNSVGKLSDSKLWLTLCGTTIKVGHSEEALTTAQQQWIQARIEGFLWAASWNNS